MKFCQMADIFRCVCISSDSLVSQSVSQTVRQSDPRETQERLKRDPRETQETQETQETHKRDKEGHKKDPIETKGR